MLRLVITLCTCVFLLANVRAQLLPRGLSAAEREALAAGFLQKPTVIPGALSADELSTPPRAMAEWEEMQAIVITWTGYRLILSEIVRHAAKEVEVLIVTSDKNATRSYLEVRDIDPDSNITYLTAPYNSVWIRDYGANPAYTNDVDSLVMIDWIYNRPRPLDDVMPGIVASHLDVPLYATLEAPFDLVNTGGNFMSDGNGRAFSSKLVLFENGVNNIWGTSAHTEEDVDGIMYDFMGIEEYVKMDVLPYDGIHHIDMHMKLLDETTLLVGEYPEDIADGPQIEANIQYVIEHFELQTGRSYNVVRIPMPPDHLDRYPHQGGDYRTYTNALFVNKTILVPIYEEKYDTTALRIWRELMPGYTIAGINCNAIIPAGGAIHCITKEVGVADPLLIQHFSPGELVVDAQDETMQAIVKHHMGVTSAALHFRVQGEGAYTTLAMDSTVNDIWVVDASQFPADVSLEYYFSATARNGKQVVRPLTAPEGHFTVQTTAIISSTGDIELKEPEVAVFPNPASAHTCVSVKAQRGQALEVNLLDMHGRNVRQLFRGIATVADVQCFFNGAQLPVGMYVISVRTAAGNCSRLVAIR